MDTLFLQKDIEILLKKKKIVNFMGKKSAQNTFPIFTIVWYNLKHSGMQSGTLQSGHHHTVSFFSFHSRILRTSHLQHKLQTTHDCNSPLCSVLSTPRPPKKTVQQNVHRWQHQIEACSVKTSMQPKSKFKSPTL